MLKILRSKNVTKIVLWGILLLILPAFVLWGTGAGGRSKEKGPTFVGTIDGKKVSFDGFAESIASIRCQIIMSYFGQPAIMDAFMNSKEFVGRLAWNRLIMAGEAHKAKVKVSNNEVINFVKNQPIFVRGGVFDDKIYTYALRYNMGLEPRAFEEIIRSNLEIQKFTDQLAKDVKATDEEIADAYAKDNDKIKISYVLFTGEGAAKSAHEEYDKLKNLMEKDKLNFESASAKLNLKIKESPFFSRIESLEDIGSGRQIVEEASKLKDGEVSNVIEMEKGAVIFKVSGSQKFDEEKFKKEKDEFSKGITESKKAEFLEDWLKGREAGNKLNIDLKEYDKYYR